MLPSFFHHSNQQQTLGNEVVFQVFFQLILWRNAYKTNPKRYQITHTIWFYIISYNRGSVDVRFVSNTFNLPFPFSSVNGGIYHKETLSCSLSINRSLKYFVSPVFDQGWNMQIHRSCGIIYIGRTSLLETRKC